MSVIFSLDLLKIYCVETLYVNNRRLEIALYKDNGRYIASYSRNLNGVGSNKKSAISELRREILKLIHKAESKYSSLSTVEELDYQTIISS